MSILVDKVIHPFLKPQHLVVSAPSGAGGTSYHICLDNYFLGQLHYTTDGWKVSLQHEDSLPKPYCEALIKKAIQCRGEKFGEF